MTEKKEAVRKAYMAVFMLGLVSLFGDIVYEGSRGVIPEYLKFLGASAVVVGAVMGLGELISYVSRLGGGILADKTKSYWSLVFLGYGLIAAIPFLPISQVAGGWLLAAVLIILERLGKGLRTPARDTIISFASKAIGRGKAFGLHELLDQIGAVSGPLVLALILAVSGSYTLAFGTLAIPYIILMLTLYTVYKHLKVYGEPPASEKKGAGGILSKRTVVYISAVTLNTIALFPAALILYMATNLTEAGILGAWFIPVLYAGIQLVDAPLALITGIIYDKIGLKTLFLPFLTTIIIAPLVMRGDFISIIIGAALFGLVLGTKESVYRAAIADLSTPEVRATAYGILNTAVGVGSLIAGIVYGFMIDVGAGPLTAAYYSASIGIASLVLLFLVAKK